MKRVLSFILLAFMAMAMTLGLSAANSLEQAAFEPAAPQLALVNEVPTVSDPKDAPATSDAVFAAVALLAVSATAAIVITKRQK